MPRQQDDDSNFGTPSLRPASPALLWRSSASDVIQRYESTQSTSFREYKTWKESKWGEDCLDEVQFEDDDVNLELSIPTIFAKPVLPSFGEVSAIFEDLRDRAVAYVISVSSVAVNAEYYLRRPRELWRACRIASSLWLPQPPLWLSTALFSNEIQVTAELKSQEWIDDDNLIKEEQEDEEDEEVEPPQTPVQKAHKYLNWIAFWILAAIGGTISVCVVLGATIARVLLDKLFGWKPGSRAGSESSEPVVIEDFCGKTISRKHSDVLYIDQLHSNIEDTPTTTASTRRRDDDDTFRRRFMVEHR